VVRKNLAATWAMMGVFFSPLVGGMARAAFATLALASFAWGSITLWTSGRARVTSLALAGYLVVVIAWPFWVDRFLWVIWPPIMLVGAAGARAAWLALNARARPVSRLAPVAVAAAVLLVAGHVTYNARGLARGWESKASADMTAAATLLIRQVNGDRRLDGKLVAAELAPMLALYSGLQVLPVEILTPREHVVDKDRAAHTAELERIDRRFRPEAYIVMQAGPFYAALAAAKLDSSRTLVDISPPGAPVRTILVQR
jgi:hypothetical protein